LQRRDEASGKLIGMEKLLSCSLRLFLPLHYRNLYDGHPFLHKTRDGIPKVREVRKQIKKALETASPQEAEQLRVLDAYATGILTALNTDGVQPLTFATVQASQILEEIEASLQNLLKKGAP
jgi:hypothetical protein